MKGIVFDLEANGFLEDADTVWCAVLKETDTGQLFKYPPHQIDEAIEHLSKADVLIGHNIINYDIPLIRKLYGSSKLEGVPVFDTLVVSMLLQADRQRPRSMKGRSGPHSLEAWGYRVGRGKPSHEDWTQYSEDMLHRCSEDVEINYLTYLELCREGSFDHTDPLNKEATWHKSLMLEQRAREYANEVENNAFPVDVAKMQGYIDWLEQEMKDVEDEIIPTIPPKPIKYGVSVSKPFKKNGELSKMVTDWVDEEEHTLVSGPFSRITWETINLGSDNQLKEYLFSLGWVPTEWNYKKVTAKESADPSSPYYKQEVGQFARIKGQQVKTSPKLTEDSYDSLRTDVGQKLAHYLKCSHRKSLLVGLLEAEKGGRISQRFTGLTPTGRYKHSVLVNIPGSGWFGHEIRQCFTTTEGYSLVGVDAASCQLRMLAHYMQDEDYIVTVTTGEEVDEATGRYQGTDVHTVNGIAAGLISRDVVEEFSGRLVDDIVEKDINKWSKLQEGRRKSKNFIYGFLFGAGIPKIASTLGCSVKEASTITSNILEGLPALGRLRQRLDKVHEQRGYLFGLDGRKLFVRKPHMRLVYLLQNAEAVFMKVAWCLLREGAKRRGLDTHDVCFMHDEFQTLVAHEDVEEYTKLAHNSFERAGQLLKLRCPTAGGPLVGSNWSETH